MLLFALSLDVEIVYAVKLLANNTVAIRETSLQIHYSIFTKLES